MTDISINEPTGVFDITVQEVKTTTLDSMQDVIKFVTWSIKYTKDSTSEQAGTYTTELPSPTTEGFIEFGSLTKDQLVSWIEQHDERVPGIKNYLQQKVNTEIEKAGLTTKPLPWAT